MNNYGKTSQDILIGGNSILNSTKRIMNVKEFMTFTIKNSKINIRPKSFYLICSMNKQNTEATIMNLCNFTYPQMNNLKISPHQIDSLYSNGIYPSNDVPILDSNDLNPEDQYLLLKPNIKARTKTEVNPIILKCLQHKTIAKQFIWLLDIWKTLHAILIIISIMQFVHLWCTIRHIYPECILYAIIGLVILLLNLMTSIVALVDINNKKPYQACNQCTNYRLITSIILSAILLNLICDAIALPVIKYLALNTSYRLLYHFNIILIVILLLFNFKMREFFEDYGNYLPVKLCLIPDTNIEDFIPTEMDSNPKDGYTPLI